MFLFLTFFLSFCHILHVYYYLNLLFIIKYFYFELTLFIYLFWRRRKKFVAAQYFE